MSSDPKFCKKLQWREGELKLWIQDSELHLALAEAWDRVWVLLFLSSSNLQVSTTWPSFRIPDQFAHMSLFYSKSLCSAHKNPDLGMWEISYKQIKWLFPPQSQYVVLNRTVSQPLLKSLFCLNDDGSSLPTTEIFTWSQKIEAAYTKYYRIQKSLWHDKKTQPKTKPPKKNHQFHDYTR